MATVIKASLLVLIIFTPIAASAQTNLSVAWRICEQHGKQIGLPTAATGPARWVFAQGYGGCETIEKLVLNSKSAAVDPNKLVMDQMLIEKAIHDPTGKP